LHLHRGGDMRSGMNDHIKPRPAAGWPSVTPGTVFDYCFSVWPDETSGRMVGNGAVFPLFRAIRSRVVMEFTEREFNDFREELAKVGLTLREIERAPHLDSELVY
jgi:hypothetical protein